MAACCVCLLRPPGAAGVRWRRLLPNACPPRSACLQVHVRVTIPKKVSADERKLLEELKAASSKARVGPFGF